MMLCFAKAQEIELTSLQFEELNRGFDQHLIDIVLLESSTELNKRLSKFEQVPSILLKQKWLQKLAQLNLPSQTQRLWVDKLSLVDERLSTANPDHPEQQLTLVNIAQQAKSTQRHWLINQHAAQLNKLWETSKWSWQKLSSGIDSSLANKAFRKWVNKLNRNTAKQVAKSYLDAIEQGMEPNNEFLSLLAERGTSIDSYILLWQQKSDEHSHRALRNLPILLEEHQVVVQLILASNNTALSSQAFFAMASKYSDNREVQKALLSALSDSQAKWQVAGVVGKIKDQAFINVVESRLSQQKSSAFNQLALRNLQKGNQG
jgi:hypothetical protein